MPNQIRISGLRQTSREVTQFEDSIGVQRLEELRLKQPHILSSVAEFYNREMGSDLISFLQHMPGYKKTYGDQGINTKDLIISGSEKVMWRGQRPPYVLYKIVRDTPPDNTGMIGRYRKPFPVYTERNPGKKVRLATPMGTYFEFIVQGHPTEIEPGVWRSMCQRVGEGDEIGIPAKLLTKDISLYRSGLHAGERSYEGAGVEFTHGEWFESNMMAGRMEIGMSGDAMYTQATNKYLKLLFTDKNGKDITNKHAEHFVLVDKMNDYMIAKLNKYIRHMLMWAQTTKQDDGSWIRDAGNNLEIRAGKGLFWQSDRGNRYPTGDWVGRGGWKIVDHILGNMDRLSGGTEDKVVFVNAGRERRNQLRAMFTELLKAEPAIAFMEKNNLGKGINLDFDFYKVDGVTMIIGKDTFSDSPWLPQALDEYGSPYKSHEACFVNLTKLRGGVPPIQVFTLGNEKGNRSFIKGRLPGMADPQGGIITTPIDQTETHCYSAYGIVNYNPYGGMAYAFKPVDYDKATF